MQPVEDVADRDEELVVMPSEAICHSVWTVPLIIVLPQVARSKRPATAVDLFGNGDENEVGLNWHVRKDISSNKVEQLYRDID